MRNHNWDMYFKILFKTSLWDAVFKCFFEFLIFFRILSNLSDQFNDINFILKMYSNC